MEMIWRSAPLEFFRHRLPVQAHQELVVHDEAAVRIDEAQQEIEPTRDRNVHHIGMPLLIGGGGPKGVFPARARRALPSEFRLVESEQAWYDPLIHALHSDLIILGYPHSPGLSEPWSGERLVPTSGVPALFIPDSWTSTIVGQNIVVAWNGTREARRAIIDAMPLLKSAKSVTVLVVDAIETPDRYSAEPGADISHYLARHDVAVQLRQVTSNGASVAQVILANAALQGSDLVVIGAYSHARLVDLIFGGVTRELLACAAIPMLLSH
jgi:nucleotide-binding universal stress UspA family protein